MRPPIKPCKILPVSWKQIIKIQYDENSAFITTRGDIFTFGIYS